MHVRGHMLSDLGLHTQLAIESKTEMASGGWDASDSSPDREEVIVRGKITCSVCLQVYQQPRYLPCLHTLCLPCLQQLATHHTVSALTFYNHKLSKPSSGLLKYPSSK